MLAGPIVTSSTRTAPCAGQYKAVNSLSKVVFPLPLPPTRNRISPCRTSPSAGNQEFVRNFRVRYGRNPDTWAAQGYDALRILAKAVKATGSCNPLDLSYAIRFMDPWEGANGLYKFDSRGELDDKPIFLKVYRNGTPVTIYESRPGPAPHRE
jgi:Periplasmic binding protein